MSLKEIFEKIKSTVRIFQDIRNLDEYKQTLETQNDRLTLEQKLLQLESENKALKSKLQVKQHLIVKNDMYWSKMGGSTKDGPFCTQCYDDDEKLMRLHTSGNPAYKVCPKCGTAVQVGPDELESRNLTFDQL